MPESIKKFIKWIQDFDYRLLANIDEIKIKLILPMFAYLDYPEKCRHSQHVLKTDESETENETPEISLIYFATDDYQENNPTSLVLIIIQDPCPIANLAEGVAQAKFYSLSLKPRLFIVTNGYHLQVFQRQRYREEHLLFDLNIAQLKERSLALEFYHHLNFHIVKNPKINREGIVINTKYSLIEKSLRRQRDLQDLLVKSDFQPRITREGNRLIVVQPKVAIACNLPEAMKPGDCQIEFSNIMLRGLKITVNHQKILGELMMGLHTQPQWQCRPFIKQLDKNAFEVSLAQTTVILSEIETTDLCLCIDKIAQEYKKCLIEFENILETWEFEFINFAGINGFRLFSVDYKLWQFMYEFAREFDYIKGKSEWHILHQENMSIRVSRGIRDHAFILPQPGSYWSEDTRNKINIVYQINAVHLESLAKEQAISWQENIGHRGTWTAKYTQQWLLEKYIPKVIEYYSQQSQLFEAELLPEIIKYQFPPRPIKDIQDITDILPYLQDIQSWFNQSCLNIYIENISVELLRPYYRAFTDLVRNTDYAITGIDYIMGNLRGLPSSIAAAEIPSHGENGEICTWKNALICLDEQVARINNSQYEKSFNADLITRIFIWIIQNGKISFSQAQLDAAKQALLPLWQHSRFEMRHVYPNF